MEWENKKEKVVSVSYTLEVGQVWTNCQDIRYCHSFRLEEEIVFGDTQKFVLHTAVLRVSRLKVLISFTSKLQSFRLIDLCLPICSRLPYILPFLVQGGLIDRSVWQICTWRGQYVCPTAAFQLRARESVCLTARLSVHNHFYFVGLPTISVEIDFIFFKHVRVSSLNLNLYNQNFPTATKSK